MALKTLQTDDNGDLYIVDGSSLGVLHNKDAVIQDVSSATKKILGENPFNTLEGVDYFGTVFSPTPDYDQFRLQLMEAALTVADVTDVVSIEITQNGDQISYTMQINTIYGPATVASPITR